MEINTHGRKINLETLTNASDSTKGLGTRTGEYVEIFYDKSTGDVWCKYHWIARNGRSTTTLTSRRLVLRYDTRPSSRSRT